MMSLILLLLRIPFHTMRITKKFDGIELVPISVRTDLSTRKFSDCYQDVSSAQDLEFRRIKCYSVIPQFLERYLGENFQPSLFLKGAKLTLVSCLRGLVSILDRISFLEFDFCAVIFIKVLTFAQFSSH